MQLRKAEVARGGGIVPGKKAKKRDGEKRNQTKRIRMHVHGHRGWRSWGC